jgi:hypothetical protein
VKGIAHRLSAFGLTVSLLLTLCPLMTAGAQKPVYVTVSAGTIDRRESVASFGLPANFKARFYGLRDDKGKLLPMQVTGKGLATFILPELKAGETRRYRLEALKTNPLAKAQGVQLIKEGNRLNVSSGGRKVLGYQAEAGEVPSPDIKPIFKRGGYIHPVFTPSGQSITDDFPADHRHHHGIWFAWTKTEFEGRHPDFWNVGDGTGTVEFVALDQTWSGDVYAGFKSRLRSVDLSAPKPKAVLNEEWEVNVYRVGLGQTPYAMFDVVVTQTGATTSPLLLPEYRYGGIGFRGHSEWLDKSNCFFLTSEGKDRANGNGTRARWCHIGGRIGGKFAGIAILDHPTNFRAPQPTRLNPDQPFFCYAPSVMGEWEIGRGQEYVSRYRFIVYDGEPDVAAINHFWDDYANPVQVTVK